MWDTSVPILVFLGLSVLDLGPMYATDVRQKHRLMPPLIKGGGITVTCSWTWQNLYRLLALVHLFRTQQNDCLAMNLFKNANAESLES